MTEVGPDLIDHPQELRAWLNVHGSQGWECFHMKWEDATPAAFKLTRVTRVWFKRRGSPLDPGRKLV